MDIVLGVSMTPTTVRMVLVEGEKADGVTVDHDVFDIGGADGSATMTAADQVVAAVLGTQESAIAGGHQLKATGVTWTDHSDASALRDALTAHGIDDVMLVSEGHAAAALAQAVGHAVGYDTTALLFIDRDAATLSVVKTDDGSVVKVLGRSLHSSDAMAVLTEMAAAVDAQDAAPQAMFVVGSGVDVSSVKAHLENLVSLPVSAPDEPELALARGAALAAANAPALEASTVGLAYSQDPDGTTAGSALAGLAALPTELDDALVADELPVEEGRKPFLLVGSALTSIFVIGVVALVISLAVSIRPTVDQRPAPAQGAVIPAAPVKPAAPAPAPVPEAQPAPQAPPPAPPPETIKAPIPVVQEAPQPRTVVVDQQPAAIPQAPAPAAPAPAPEAPPPAPLPLLPPAPVYNPPVYNPPGYIPPLVVLPPILRPPVVDPPRAPWQPPWQRQPVDVPDSPPWQPPSRQNPDSQWPYPGSRSGGSGDWGPGSSSRGGDNGWNPGRHGDDGGNDGGGRGGNGNGGSIWWPFGGGH